MTGYLVLLFINPYKSLNMKPLLYLNVTAIALATLLPHADAQQILAPGPDNTTIADGESLYISSGENVFNGLDAFIIAIGGTLNNNFGGTLNNDYFGTLYNGGSLDNLGTLTNFNWLHNYDTLDNGGTLHNYDTLYNGHTLTNDGTLTNAGTLDNNFGATLTNNGMLTNTLGAVVNTEFGNLINNSTLNNNGTINGDVSITSAGIFTGSGTINGEVSLAGTIAPGNSPGTMTTGSQTWITGASYDWEINDSGGTAGVEWDLLDIVDGGSGVLDLSGLNSAGYTINIFSLNALNELGNATGFDMFDTDNGTADYEFILVSTDGGITGFEAADFVLDDTSFANDNVNWDWAVIVDGNDLKLQAFAIAAVPEPSSTALLGLGGLALMLRRRR